MLELSGLSTGYGRGGVGQISDKAEANDESHTAAEPLASGQPALHWRLGDRPCDSGCGRRDAVKSTTAAEAESAGTRATALWTELGHGSPTPPDTRIDSIVDGGPCQRHGLFR